jgi:hypothetical protein
MVYQLTLTDLHLIRDIFNFFDINFSLILQWGRYNPSNAALQQNPVLQSMGQLPEHFIEDMAEFYTSTFKMN